MTSIITWKDPREELPERGQKVICYVKHYYYKPLSNGTLEKILIDDSEHYQEAIYTNSQHLFFDFGVGCRNDVEVIAWCEKEAFTPKEYNDVFTNFHFTQSINTDELEYVKSYNYKRHIKSAIVESFTKEIMKYIAIDDRYSNEEFSFNGNKMLSGTMVLRKPKKDKITLDTLDFDKFFSKKSV
jgi:hypothetical protein